MTYNASSGTLNSTILLLSSGNFHHTLKYSVISPLLEKPNLDKDELSNYCQISLTSKRTEPVVKSRLSEHLTPNNLLKPHQSAYCKIIPLKLLCYTYRAIKKVDP